MKDIKNLINKQSVEETENLLWQYIEDLFNGYEDDEDDEDYDDDFYNEDSLYTRWLKANDVTDISFEDDNFYYTSQGEPIQKNK